MEKQIPIYFDSAVILSPAQPISNSEVLSRVKVGAFTKYGNRNGSYISDEVADQLIASATKGDTPVIGFFDPETKDWASHTGPTLASAYGYVEAFDGWQPFTDTDGETRDYAVFTAVLFNRYFEEANFVIGQHQSMELDINSIQGDWADINGIEYFVYTQAKIIGFCIIGSHEPCFSVSSFFSKQDDTYATQYEKFSSLLSSLKAQVEEAEQGGEHRMENEFNMTTPEQSEVEPETVVVEPDMQVPETEVPAQEFENQESTQELETGSQAVEPVVDFEAQIAELQNQINELTTSYEHAQTCINDLEAQITSASETEATLRETIANYEAERAQIDVERRNSLIERYENLLEEEDISAIRAQVENFSYAELESKLAICYANKQMAGSADNKVVPLPEPTVNQFALLMEKYRKK